MTGSIVAEIIHLLADKCGLPPEKIQLSDRLLQDLGLDGDGAVDFFVALQERFGTDLTHLREHWSEHFRSERTSCWTALGPFPTLIVGVFVAAARSGSLVAQSQAKL